MPKNSSAEALVPGMNVPYGLRFGGIRKGRGEKLAGPGWREMGGKSDKQFCFASLPGAAGKDFMGQVGVWLAACVRRRCSRVLFCFY